MSSIFDLHRAVLSDYRDFVRSFFLIADERARAFVEQAVQADGHLWPEPLVQLSPAYASGRRVDELAREGRIAQETARIFCQPDGRPFRLYRHQEEMNSARAAGWPRSIDGLRTLQPKIELCWCGPFSISFAANSRFVLGCWRSLPSSSSADAPSST